MLTLLKHFKKDRKGLLAHLDRRSSDDPSKILSAKDISITYAPLPSFLLESERFVCYNSSQNKNLNGASIEDRIIYLFLAGKRDLLDYKMKGIDSIPLEFSEFDINKLKSNKLLSINDNTIKFNKVPATSGN